jgi:hypothetical protein
VADVDPVVGIEQLIELEQRSRLEQTPTKWNHLVGDDLL